MTTLGDCSLLRVRCYKYDFRFHIKLNIRQMFFWYIMEDNDIIKRFSALQTRRDVAKVLGSTLKSLSYNLYVLAPEKRYNIFQIPKKNGGNREICAPTSALKYLQRQLADILVRYQEFRPCVHGYVKSRSIKSNALVHRGKRIVINVDLKDFFNTINFGRVRGIFLKSPFNFNNIIATTIAQICCHNGVLPQGSPASPIITNYACRKLDSELQAFSRKHKMNYSRYADDITFSTNMKFLSPDFGELKDNLFFLSKDLRAIIENNGFVINESKTRYALQNNRQDVTGLIVNDKVNVPRKYVKRIRAMLHAWEKFGIENATKEHLERFNYKHKHPDYPEIAFKNELVGMINYVCYIKGKNNSVYYTLYNRLHRLDSNIKLSIPETTYIPENAVIIYCEGKTDSLHLKAAYDYYKNIDKLAELNLYFHMWREDLDINNDRLFQICQNRPQMKNRHNIEIYLFDRDDSRYNAQKLCAPNQNYKNWGSNVYSTLLPIPSHRSFNEICIEHFYSDADMKKSDEKNRRLYTTDEFDANSGNHKENEKIYFDGTRSKLKCKYPKILDTNIRNIDSSANIALSKKDFANNIASKRGNFKDISFEYFKPIFDLFEEIIEKN